MNSHYAERAAAWNVPENNYGLVMEKFVAKPEDDTSRNIDIQAALGAITAKLATAPAPEPCNDTMDDTCSVSRGLVSYCIH